MKLRHLFENDSQPGVPLPVFRGMALANDKRTGDTIAFPIRKDRIPMDSTMLFSAIFNLAIGQSLGVQEVRKRSAYASTNRSIAQSYATRSDEISRPGHSGGVVQLYVAPSATIVFNPRVEDSFHIEEEMAELHETLLELADSWVDRQEGRELGDFWQMSPSHNKQNYISQSAQDFIRAIAEAGAEGDQEVAKKFLSGVDTMASMIADGYQKMTAQEFSDHFNGSVPNNFEVMISGVDSFTGVVVG